jgi:hypothetical protein
LGHIAGEFYAAWRALNDRDGIPDYGHRHEMKELTARYITRDVEIIVGAPMPEDLFEQTVEELIDLMNRPKHRRKRMRLPPEPPSK